jgi:WD40 repeat protein
MDLYNLSDMRDLDKRQNPVWSLRTTLIAVLSGLCSIVNCQIDEAYKTIGLQNYKNVNVVSNVSPNRMVAPNRSNFSVSRKYFAVPTMTGEVCIFDTLNYSCISRINSATDFTLEECQLSPDGKYISMFGRKNGSGVVKLVNVTSKTVIYNKIYDISDVGIFSDDSRFFAYSYRTTDFSHGISLIDVRTGKTLELVVQGYIAGFRDYHFTPDSKYIIASCYQSSYCIWETETGKLVKSEKSSIDFGGFSILSNSELAFLQGDKIYKLNFWFNNIVSSTVQFPEHFRKTKPETGCNIIPLNSNNALLIYQDGLIRWDYIESKQK